MENFFKYLPGILLCLFIGTLVKTISSAHLLVGFDQLLLALLLGITFRNLFPRSNWYIPGGKLCEKYILELSIMILGATIFFPSISILNTGLLFLVISGILGGLIIALLVGKLFLNMDMKLVTLVGVSNSICGNAAAATIAPIIGASSTQLASVISISSLLGAAQIILLPIFFRFAGLSEYHYGVITGMTVYSVSQVYAASIAVSPQAASIATIVKLSRVIFIGPVVLGAQIMNFLTSPKSKFKRDHDPILTMINRYIPWFLIGFFVLGFLRSIEIINIETAHKITNVSDYTFIIAMVGVGLSVELTQLFRVGPKLGTLILCVSIFMLGVSSIGGLFLI
jgi:uncharacterized integral membrane protein (TIGR00698 family)